MPPLLKSYTNLVPPGNEETSRMSALRLWRKERRPRTLRNLEHPYIWIGWIATLERVRPNNELHAGA
jgi:hypothetical protein